MDSADNYIEKQRQLEKQAVEKYGLMNGDGKRVYMSYNKYLQQKADVPLYLATANTNQIGNLQAELSDRNNNVTQKIKKSSADLTDFYKGAEIFAAKRRTNCIKDNYPFYRALVELGGENAKVLLPKGEIYKNYSGAFIAHRKLKNGTAVPLKDIVEKIQQSGTDTKNLEGKILKFFDGLNISKLYQAYRDSMIDPASKTIQEHETYLLNKLSENKTFSQREAAEIGISTRAVKKHLATLRANSIIKRVGPDNGGSWIVITENKKDTE